MADLDALLALAERVAMAGAEHLRTSMHHADLHVSTKVTPTDLVTDVDRSCETLVVDLLTSARPDDGLVGEEGSSIAGRSGVDWVVDPLDGTTNFVYGHPGFSVSIGAVIDGRPSIGVVADPLTGDLFSARAGAGPLATAPCSASEHRPTSRMHSSRPGSPTTPVSVATRPRCSPPCSPHP